MGPSVQLFRGVSNIPPPTMVNLVVTWPPPPPYNHTVVELGNTTSWEKCQEACIGFRNPHASPVSGWVHCQSFTWLERYHRSVAIVDGTSWDPVVVPGSTTGRLKWPPSLVRPMRTAVTTANAASVCVCVTLHGMATAAKVFGSCRLTGVQVCGRSHLMDMMFRAGEVVRWYPFTTWSAHHVRLV